VVEIRKATQTLLIVDSGVVRRTYNTSTGSNQRYLQGGRWHVAVTPSGSFKVFRRVNAWDNGPLGRLYRPQSSTAALPSTATPRSRPRLPRTAAAGVSLRAMDNLWGVGGIRVGTPVLVY
jgi:hypothetical protein